MESPKYRFWFCALILVPVLLMGQMLSAASPERKIRQKVAPEYPELARHFNASGIVKLQIEVTPTGEVKNVKTLGGSPLLIPAAVDAVRKWKYEPAKESSDLVVEFQFVPNQ